METYAETLKNGKINSSKIDSLPQAIPESGNIIVCLLSLYFTKSTITILS